MTPGVIVAVIAGIVIGALALGWFVCWGTKYGIAKGLNW